jgi:hypothetical protein
MFLFPSDSRRSSSHEQRAMQIAALFLLHRSAKMSVVGRIAFLSQGRWEVSICQHNQNSSSWRLVDVLVRMGLRSVRCGHLNYPWLKSMDTISSPLCSCRHLPSPIVHLRRSSNTFEPGHVPHSQKDASHCTQQSIKTHSNMH